MPFPSTLTRPTRRRRQRRWSVDWKQQQEQQSTAIGDRLWHRPQRKASWGWGVLLWLLLRPPLQQILVFGGNVLDDTATINASMEIYCRNILLLLFPFRSKNDLIIEGSYTKRLCSVIYNHEPEKTKFEYFLNNIQNCQANCLRVPAQKDELEENTKMYSSEWNMIQDEEEEDQQNMTGELTGDTLTEFLQLLKQEDISDAILDLKVIDLSFLRKKGDMLVDTKTWHN